MSAAARTPVVVAALRTPIGRHGGALAPVRPDDLAAGLLEAVVERTGLEPATVDDVLLGCTNQAGEDNRNVARMALLRAGYPVTVPGQTVNRLCGSGMQAVLSAAHAITAGHGECFVAGGVESMSRAPWVMLKPGFAWPRGAPETADTVLGWRFANPALPQEWTMGLGQTAEVVAREFGIGRDAQDAFAAESQRRCAAAVEAGRFDDEIVPVPVPQRRGDPLPMTADEHPRPGTTPEKLARLRPVFADDGTVTAGNASGINDGAAALLVMSAARAEADGFEPLARLASGGLAGLEPHRMGMGPVPATRAALHRAGWSIDEVELAEVNEAFAAQAIPCCDELGLDRELVNVNGGAIALGHPVGCSGARIVVTLLHEMARRGVRRGLATMCIGVGQGIATLWEKA